MLVLARRWVCFWDERESPAILASIRILLAVVLLSDLATIGVHGLAVWIWGAAEGMAAFDPAAPPLFYRVFSPEAGSARLLWLGLVLSALSFGAGFFTRTSAAIFVVLYTQTALINPAADRAIDRAIRIVLLILMCSGCGRVWSVDAKLETGGFRGVGRAVSAWPRYLILGQLVLLYFAAGLAKSGTAWYPWGGYNALYLILQDPIYAARDFSWLSHPVFYLGSRVATAVTHLWELGAPIVLVAAYYRRTESRPGRARRLANRLPIRNAYVAVGVIFHLALAGSMRLGIFPFAMLAFFPAFFRPEELERALPARLRPMPETEAAGQSGATGTSMMRT